MAEAKTKPTNASVEEFLQAVPNATRRADSFVVLEMMKRVTNQEPVMWGPSIVGFGQYHYQYASGHEGDAPIVAFSPRKQALTLYLESQFDRYDELMSRLGTFTTSKACLYIKKLSDVDLGVLEELIRESYAYSLRRQPKEVE